MLFLNNIIFLFWEINYFVMQNFPARLEHKYDRHENVKKNHFQ